jgi:predicted Ser/Thr protein kinase
VPYVVGQWVRGDRFYGRAAQLAEILEGPRDSVWLLGTRRIGKTSVLKQLEHLAVGSPERGYLPLFWDFQGSADPEELHLGFHDAVLDAEERLAEVGVGVEKLEAEDLFASLGHLRRRLRSQGLKLLLLCDEVEELIKLQRQDESLLRKLRRAMQWGEEIRSVLTSTIRLWALAEERGDTSPFLHGFTPPLYLAPLEDEEARSLLRQEQMAADNRPVLAAGVVEEIRSRCDDHPYLLQLVGKRFVETGDLEEALEQVAADDMVSHFFAVDYDMLSPSEQGILRTIAAESAASSGSLEERLSLDRSQLTGGLLRLESLGFVRRAEKRRFELRNHFFRRWLRELPAPEENAGRSRALVGLRGLEDDQSTEPQVSELGIIDDRYELLRRAGEGATGLVYKAYDRLLKAPVAIKLLRPEYAFNENILERFRQEIVLSRDLGHPNILRVYHLGEYDGKKFLTMQWVEGSTLDELIAAEAPLAEEEVASIGHKIASALETAHGQGVLHRDIKPQNILLDSRREPLVTDFGLARRTEGPGITTAGMFLGTPNYVSPEQATMLPLDERSDIYALGVVLFEMATGRRPFRGETVAEILEMHRSVPAPDPREVEPGVSAQLASVIARCLRKEPGGRYTTAGDLRQALVSINSQAPTR